MRTLSCRFLTRCGVKVRETKCQKTEVSPVFTGDRGDGTAGSINGSGTDGNKVCNLLNSSHIFLFKSSKVRVGLNVELNVFLWESLFLAHLFLSCCRRCYKRKRNNGLNGPCRPARPRPYWPNIPYPVSNFLPSLGTMRVRKSDSSHKMDSARSSR